MTKKQYTQEENLAEARRRITEAKEIGSTILKLEHLNLTTLPPEIANLTTLELLGLANNQLTTLPPEIVNLTALEHLDLDNNHLTTLPPEIANLTALKILYLAKNQLTALPPEIATLTALEYLDLDNNQFTTLPTEITNLTALKALDLDNNQLTTLPPEIANLTTLELLGLVNNNLTTLPPEITNLTTLEILGLTNNQLTTLPPEIINLTALEDLFLNNNLLPTAITESLDDGIPSLFSYLASQEGDTAPLYEAKLIITGEGQVGKSWSLAAICDDDPEEVVGPNNTTWGIDCGELPLPHPDKHDVDIHLNTWDFGGQQVYRTTHQFFFSEQAIFLLVWNPRKGPVQCRVKDWLRTIALRTGSQAPFGKNDPTKVKPRAKVIMVATHAKAPGGNYNPEYGHDSLDLDLQNMIVDTIEIDSRTRFQIDKLKTMIAKHAADLPDMGAPFNQNWAAARDAVLAERHKHPWITFNSFAQICADHNVTETIDLQTLASTFMNRLGRAVWYGPDTGGKTGNNTALLADTLVLDAVWLSRAFVQILEDIPTKRSGGVLDHQRFGEIWTDHGRPEWKEYLPEEYGRIATMMRRFDVALPTRDSAGERSLVPQLVPDIRPALPWTTADNAPGQRLVRLSCQLDYEAEGLMARFIAATERYHVYQNGTGLFWQEGVFLSDQVSFANEALVTIEGTEKPVINITVSGDQPGFLIDQLYRTLEKVIEFWAGMSKTYNILCATNQQGSNYCTGKFKFDTVQRRASKTPSQSLDCQVCDEQPTPDQLLHGLQAVRVQRERDPQLDFLFNEKTKPCPSTFLLEPVGANWKQVTSWAHFYGTKFKLTLVSEYSGSPVTSKEFTIKEEWTKWLGPLTKIVSFALTGLAGSLDGEPAKQLTEGATTLDKMAALPTPDGVSVSSQRMGASKHQPNKATDAQLHQLNAMLIAIDLDPKINGMQLAQTSDGRWLWMTTAEAQSFVKTEAKF